MFARLQIGDDVVVSNRRSGRTVGAGALTASGPFRFTVDKPSGPETFSRFTHRVVRENDFKRRRLRELFPH